MTIIDFIQIFSLLLILVSIIYPIYFRERIGDKEEELSEKRADVKLVLPKEIEKDGVAADISWLPLTKIKVFDFRPYNLYVTNNSRLEYLPVFGAATTYMVTFTLLFFMLPVIGYNKFGISFFFIVPFAIAFFFKTISRPICFDLQYGYYWRGLKSPNMVLDVSEIVEAFRLIEIYAFQLIPEKYTLDGEEDSWQLNLVLKDKRRIYVVSSNNLEKLRSQAKQISTFLKKILWDVSHGAID